MMPLAFFERSPDPQVRGVDLNDIVAMQLMCSRICHDLSGPAGAIAAAIEIIGDLESPDPDALQLIAESSQVFRDRLSFLRTAFGFGGSAIADSSLAQIVGVAADSMRAGRVTLELIHDKRQSVDMGKARPADVGRLFLCLVSEMSRGLPRGGNIKVHLQERRRELMLRLKAVGVGARLSEELLTGVDLFDRDGVTSRNVSIYYLYRLLARLGATIDFRTDAADEFIGVVVIPEATT